MDEIGRRQRFRRRLRGEQKAVSPVVATLILILIAVAAAAALYLWLVAWQGGVTKGIGSPGAQYTVTIGGSTSVYPFDSYAVTQFEQNNSDVVVSNNQGGSGAGMLSVCAGQVDIGTASALESLTQLEQPVSAGGYGCPASPTPTLTTVAYDAVDVIVPVANAHGLVSINADTILSIYIAGDGGIPAFQASGAHFPGNFPTAAYYTNGVSFVGAGGAVASTGFIWNQIPACSAGTTTCISTELVPFGVDTATPAVVAAVPGTEVPCAAPFAGDLCDQAVADATTCGFTVCAGGTGAAASTDTVQPWARADTSGTEQSFTARILGIGDSAGTVAGLGYTGCAPDGQLGSCGINPPSAQQGQGNPGVISGVAAHPDAIGFASDGLARATGSGVSCSTSSSPCVGLQAIGQSASVIPSTGSGGEIAAGILGNAAGYQGWRPFEYWTLGAPTGEVQRFINFVMDPANNQAFATEAAEVSVYSI